MQVRTPTPTQEPRFRELDLARGVAMMGVIVSHSAQFIIAGWTQLAWLMITVGMVATPTFLLLSGLLVGERWAKSPPATTGSNWRVIDRTLFLLIVVHSIIGVTHALWQPAHTALLGNFYITDAIGASVLLSYLLFRQFRITSLLVAGVALTLSSSVLLLLPSQKIPGLVLVEWLLFGIQPENVEMDGYVVPLVPYLGVFLMGAAMGRRYAASDTSREATQEIGRFMFKVGAICMVSAIGLKLTWLLVLKGHIPATLHWPLYRLLEPMQKIPPSLSYFLAFGGAGVFAAGCLHLLPKHLSTWFPVKVLAVIGRSSLAVFVAQFWVIELPAKVFGFNDVGWYFPAVFAGCFGILCVIARVWDVNGCNRYLTFGVRQRQTASALRSA